LVEQLLDSLFVKSKLKFAAFLGDD